MKSKFIAVVTSILLICSICQLSVSGVASFEESKTNQNTLPASVEAMTRVKTLSVYGALAIVDSTQCPYCGLDTRCFNDGSMYCPHCGYQSSRWDCASRTPFLANYELGALSCWYSDSDSIGRWKTESVEVYTKQLNTNSDFNFMSGIENGCLQWEDVTGMLISISRNASSPIRFYGGTADEINACGEVTFQQGTNGCTWIRSRIEGVWRYDSEYKIGKAIVAAYGYVVDNGRTANEYVKTCTHELGHAFGWFGHSSDRSDIMYTTGSSVTILTTRDSNYLSQVYHKSN